VAWDEWNVWYRARGNDQRGRNILEEHYNLEDALVVSTFLNSFVNHSNVVKIANMAQLVNVIAPIFTNDTGMFLQTIYYPLQLFATYAKGKSLALLSEGPQYMTRSFGDVPYLDTSAAFDNTSDNTRDNGTLILNVTNRHPSQAITADVILADKQFSGAVTVREVNGPDIKAENDFTTTRVKTVQKSVTAQGKTLTYNFPAHSFTMLQVKLG